MKILLQCLIAIGLVGNASAQYIQKIDVLPYFNRIPTPPPTPKECYDNVNFSNGTFNADKIFKPIKDEVENIIKNISQPNEAAQTNAANAKNLTDQMQKDNVKNMTQDQQLEYMKTHGQNVQGMPSAAKIDFAQKMQDPAFKAQFEKMTPQEKMAYMQNSGAMNTSVSPGSMAPVVAIDAINAGQKMGTDYQPLLVRQHNELQQVADSSKIIHDAIEAEKTAELKKLPTHIEGEGFEVYNDPSKAKAIEQKCWNKHMEHVQKEIIRYKQLLSKHTKEWQTAVTPYNAALAKIHYGDDIVNEKEMKEKDMLASYQSQMFSYVAQLLEESKNIYQIGAEWEKRYQDFIKSQNNK